MAEKYAEKRYWQTPSSRQKRVRVLTWIIVAAAALGPLAFLLTVTKSDPPLPPIYTPPQYQAPATAVLEAWIEGEASPIPVNIDIRPTLRKEPLVEGKNVTEPINIKNVSWSTYSQIPNNDPQQVRELHRFLGVMSGQGVYIFITIAGSEFGPVLASDPTIVAAPFLPGEHNVTYIEGETLTVSSGLKEQIGLWAVAYGANDRNTLLRLTGDAEGRTYVGIPGGNYTPISGPTVSGAFVTPDGKNIVRVTIKYAYVQKGQLDENQPTGTSTTTTTILEQKSFTLQFELLIDDIDNVLPSIVAWGPVGTANLLEPFSNALPESYNNTGEQENTEDSNPFTSPTPQTTTPTNESTFDAGDLESQPNPFEN